MDSAAKAYEPYTKHLSKVAQLVAESGGDEAQVAAAWLHDVVEDTPIPLSHIGTVFGPDIVEITVHYRGGLLFPCASRPSVQL